MNDFNFQKNLITIKQAGEKDIPIIEDILLDACNHFGIWSKERISWTGLSTEFTPEDFHIAYIDGNPAGCMALQDSAPFFWTDKTEKGEALYLRRLAVKRCEGGRNFSKYLLEYAVNQCREKNIKTLRLDTGADREKLMQLYESFGFVCEKREMRKIGEKEYDIAYFVLYIDER